MRQILGQILVSVLVLMLMATCISCTTSALPTSPPFPTERPKLPMPTKFELTSPLTTFQNHEAEIANNVENHLFQNCEIWISSNNLEITSCKFVNSMVFVDSSTNIIFDRVIFKDLNQYEKAALSINNSKGIVVQNCQSTPCNQISSSMDGATGYWLRTQVRCRF